MIERIVLSRFPELRNGYHLPMLGRVVNIGNPPDSGGTCTHEEPRYAVDIQPLDQHFRPRGELLRDLVVSVPWAGQNRGFFALPDPGCIVEFCFSYALPHLVHIRGIIPWDLQLPPIDSGTSRWQAGPDAHVATDRQGNWEQVGSSDQTVARDRQILKSPSTWLGSESENLLSIVSELAEAIASALDVLATHTHPGVGPSGEGASVSSQSASLRSIQKRLDGITAK